MKRLVVQLLNLFAIFSLMLLNASALETVSEKPADFIYLSEVDPTIIESVRYATSENFLGRPIPGYTEPKIRCTRKAAEQLKQAHDQAKAFGYRFVVYDGFRPQRAVNAFAAWGRDLDDLSAKAEYYPGVDKKDLFEIGYVAPERSTHTRGSTFDLTLIKADMAMAPLTKGTRTLENGEVIPFIDDNTVDMGSSFDLFHEVSHHDSPMVTAQQTQNRELLRTIMKANGFTDFDKEWWHYTLADEPYPDTYFDF